MKVGHNGNKLNITSVYKYMGILFTPKLAWTAAKQKLSCQARKAIYAIKNYERPFGNFLHKEMFKMFDSMVTPILTFGSEIWGFEYSSVIEQVQNQFCKEFIGVNSTVNNSMALGECGRLPLCTIYHVKCITYWCKLLSMPNNRYPKNCYKMLKSQDDIGRVNWATKVKELLFKYGFGFIWMSQEIGDIKWFISEFRQRITDCMSQCWHNDMINSTRCDLYKNIKTMLNPERYVMINLPFNLKKSFARFRCSSHKLNIEVGRHRGIDREFRTCTFCLTNLNITCVEDEYHVFFKCQKFEDARQNLLFSWYSGGTDSFHFYNLLKSENFLFIKRIAIFVAAILEATDKETR